LKKTYLIILLIVGLALSLFGTYYLFSGKLVFPGKVLAKLQPLTSITCPSGYYEYMNVFTECSSSAYVEPGYSNCAWNYWGVSGCEYYNPVCWKCTTYTCDYCGKQSSQPSTCPSGKSWVQEKINCPSSGRCSSTTLLGYVSCPAGPVCTDECSSGQARCKDASTRQTCGNYDADTCLEWGGDQACTYGCENGQCKSAPTAPAGTLTLTFIGLLSVLSIGTVIFLLLPK